MSDPVSSLPDPTSQSTGHDPYAVPDSVTVCVTSCARLDLLERTMASFRRFHSGGRFLISEDSADPAVIRAVGEAHPYATILSGSTRLGVMGSIDRLYSHVQTPWICHLEDDWEFSGPIDWAACMGLMEHRPDIANVSVRVFTEIKAKHRKHSDRLDFAGQPFSVMRPESHPEYYGWSPNPGLIRTALWERFKPFSAVYPDRMSGVVKEAGMTMAYALPGVAAHIGIQRNVTDPTMPARPKNKLAKIVRAFKKQLYYAGLRNDPF